MGLFSQMKNALQQEQITDIPRMQFRRYDDFAGSAIQRFADVSLPRCPMCRELPRWQLHIANITTSMFPIQEVDRYYHLRCQCCGAILHTKYHAIGSSLPNFVISPSPADPVTRMVIDEPGIRRESGFEMAMAYSIAELNRM